MNDFELRDEANFENDPVTVAAMAAAARANGPAGTGASAGPLGSSVPTPQSETDALRQAVAEQYGKKPWSLVDLEDKKEAADIRRGVISTANTIADIKNAMCTRDDMKIKIPQKIPVEIACEMIRVTGDVSALVASEDSAGTLVYYNCTGSKAGIWSADVASGGKRLIWLMDNLDVPMNQRQHAERELLAIVDERMANESTTQIPMANGVLDISVPNGFFTPYLTDEGHENPDYADLYGKDANFTHKNAANWNPHATDITLYCKDGMPWNVEDHLKTVLDGNKDAIKVWWQSCNFALRGMSGGRTMWYMDDSERGQGGGAKSTTAMMVGAAVGQNAVLDINMDKMQRQFGLAQLVGKRLLIGNETNAGTKGIDGTDVIKLIARGEPVTVERKHVDGFTYKPRCMVIQCLNTKAPKIKEKEAAFYRKIVPLYFPATLTDGVQHDEIHDEFITDQRVIDYIAFKALSLGPIDQYDPEAVNQLRKNINDIRAASSTVFQFFDEFAATFANSRIPLKILYACYNNWCKENRYNGVNFTNFESDTCNWTGMDGGWKVKNYKSSEGECAHRVSASFLPEEIIAQYGPDDLQEHRYVSNPSLREGTGMLSRKARNAQHRKWLVRVVKTEAEAVATVNDLQRYAEFRTAFVYAYGRNPQAGELTIPDPALWCKLGQPMPYYSIQKRSDPITYENFDLRGFRATTAGTDHDYGMVLDFYCKISPIELKRATERGDIPMCDEEIAIQTYNRLCGLNLQKDKKQEGKKNPNE